MNTLSAQVSKELSVLSSIRSDFLAHWLSLSMSLLVSDLLWNNSVCLVEDEALSFDRVYEM
jgi:hypothetical protein